VTTTSELAHTHHESTGKAESHRERVYRLVQQHPDHTAVELWQKVWNEDGDLSRHEISRRLPELRKLGLVHNGPARECRACGSKQMTWLIGPTPSKQGELF